ncbi:MAG TPA: lipocalin-like domain-containing protein [Thermoanaerobaculia bacterium]
MHGTSLAGAWKLLVFEFRSEGQVVFPFGTNFSGLCLYDATGYMSMQIMRGDRPRFAVNDQQAGAPDEVAAAFTGCYSYFGTYVADETHGVVVHHVSQSLFPNSVGTDLVRFYRISGERLIVSAPTQQVRGHLMDAMLVWERVQTVERH